MNQAAGKVVRRAIVNELITVEALAKLDVEDILIHVENEVNYFERKFIELFSSETSNGVP